MACVQTYPIFMLDQRDDKCWVASGRQSQTQTCVGFPAPIIMERLLPVPETPDVDENPRSSIPFLAVSEEQLQAAVKLAQRDLRRGFLDLQPKVFAEVAQEASQSVEARKAKVSTQTQTKPWTNPAASLRRPGLSPPTRETAQPRPMEGDKDASLRSEIRRLQSELEVYIQKLKESTATFRGWRTEEPLEPEEQRRLKIRQQQQAVRSARIIYELQRQVKGIQGEMKKLPNLEIWDSKKASAISKLAAVYRASRKALQQIIHPLLQSSQYKVPPHYREISQVIRQLCLCSGTVDADEGSAVALLTFNVLEKLETLDSTVSEREMLRKVQAQTCPSNRKSRVSSSRKGNHAGKRLAIQSRRIPTNLPMSREEVLRNGIIRLAQKRELEELDNWRPTSPHCSHPHQSPERGRDEETLCPFSPVKASPSPPKQRSVVSGLRAQPLLRSGKKREAQNEALRDTRLDNMTFQRLEHPSQLNKEEAEHNQRIRLDGVSPTHWAEDGEQEARERIRTFLEGQNPEVLVDDLLEDDSQAAWAVETVRHFEVMAQRRLQAPTLESMLLRLEEMQGEEEEVRRRFASINYSDAFYRDRAGSQLSAPDNPSASPQPVTFTKPALTRPSGADILLEKPVETGCSLMSQSSLAQKQQQTYNVPPESVQGHTVISVSNNRLRNIQRYRKDYNSYLHAVAHTDVCRLNPWAVAESLADELLSEAIADVATELQDVVEKSAEAVFTSEFLQPIHSRPPSTAVSQ